ncbi:hypothetical protein BHYA_0117g00140 [Botrytis hyacinthi]|uniref:Uncharacterized protein n=1 Tax=Botrytis hyacinthi TaxID=278943 RepID=A0A4Z1GQ04_9HELO|nr:hypothetical protein BHYA_0117g00140 [Botrytis hyacinthi]
MSILSHFSLPTRRAFRNGLLTVFAGCEALVYRMVERKDVGREEEEAIKDERKSERQGEKVNEKEPLEI